MTRVFVVDDHPIVRRGLIALFAREIDFEVVGECGDGLDAVEEISRVAPDLVLLDLMLPGLSGLEVARRLGDGPRPPVILVLTHHADHAYAARVLEVGASGLVAKDANPSVILSAARRLVNGGRHVPPRLRSDGDRAVDPWESLTPREREVVQLTGEGLSHREVGARLSISDRTVEVHRRNAMRKLALVGPLELVRFLIRRGILSADS